MKLHPLTSKGTSGNIHIHVREGPSKRRRVRGLGNGCGPPAVGDHSQVLEKRERDDKVENVRGRKGGNDSHAEEFDGGRESVVWDERFPSMTVGSP